MNCHFLASTLARGGAETMAVALSRRLQQRGHAVRWTLLREPGDLGESLDPGFDLRAEQAPGRWPLTGVVGLRRRLSDAEALYVLDHQNAVVLAALASGFGGPPRRVVAIHTTGLVGGRASLGRGFRMVLPRFTDVLALSPGHADYLASREGVPPAQIRVVPNGIELQGPGTPEERRAIRAEFGIPDDAPVIGSVAMLRPEKNHALLLESAARLRAEIPGLRVMLVGDGTQRESLQARAAARDLEGAVVFTGRRPDARRLLGAFDLFALTSLPAVETQPVAVLEAMDAGIPVVATRVGDLEALCEQGRSARLVPSGDLAALVEAIRDLLASRSERETLVARGADRVRSFTLDASTDALERVFSERAA